MVISGLNTTFQQVSEIRRKIGIPAGALIPVGGLAGQVLGKASPADYDTAWLTVLGGIVTAGNGIVFAGNTIHFGQAAAYTAGAIPFATGAATMGFDAANLFWDDANNFLGIGTNAPTDRLTVTRAYADAANRTMAIFTATTSVSGGTKRTLNASLQTAGAANFAGSLLSAAVVGSIHMGSGTVAGAIPIIGLELYHGKGTTGTGAVSASVGLYVQSLNQNALGAIADAYDIYIPAPAFTGAITNHTAIRIVDTGATEPVADGVVTRVGIYQAGLWDANFFGGNISVGTPAFHRNDIVRCEKTFSAITHSTGVAAVLTLNPTGVHPEWNAAGYFIIASTGVQNFTLATEALIGVIGQASHNGSGTCGGVMGGRFHALKSNTGVATTLTGIRLGIQNANAVGAVSNGYGLFVETPVVTGTITTNYQAYLSAGAGATSYGLYQAGTNDFNFFSGFVAIGTNALATNVTLRVERNYAISAANLYGIYNVLTNTSGAANAVLNIGGLFSISTAGGFAYSNSESLIGVVGQGAHTGTATATSVTGVRGTALKTGTGIVTSAYGFRSIVFNTNATNAVVTGYAYHAATPTVTGAITTYYGLYLAAGAGTTIYGIAQVGTADLNYLAGFSAFGSSAPVATTYALFGASTAAISSQRILRGSAAYAGTVEGDYWNDFTQHCLTGYIAGVKQFDCRTLFVQTASQTVTNTNAETTLFGAGVGTLTCSANFFVVGKTLEIVLKGIHTMDATPPDITFRVKLGAVTFASVNYTDLNDTNQYFEIRFLLTCRTTGAGGTGIGQGYILMHESTGAFNADLHELIMTATAAMDTTAALTLDVTAQPNAADAGSSITITNAYVRVLA